LASGFGSEPLLPSSGDFGNCGFIVVRDLVSPDEAAGLAVELGRVSGLPADQLGTAPDETRAVFYRHGGLAAHPVLWSLLVHPNVTAAVGAVLRAPPKCLPGIDTIGMHASETAPHRDASPAELPVCANQPFTEHYPVVRVILYPGSLGERFGCLPSSHLLKGRPRDLVAAAPATWRWVELQAGDAVLFDPRLVHAGAVVRRPKPMMIVTYGADGSHSIETYFLARIKTASLGFEDPTPSLLDVLADHDLLLSGVIDQANWRHFRTIWAQ
jgi:hypothetical protein